MKKLIKWLVVGVVLFSLGLALTGFMLSEDLPKGQSGPKADALAREVFEAVKAESFKNPQVVAFEFGGRNKHIWDSKRGLALVEFGEHRVMFSTHDRRGRAFIGNKEVTRKTERAALIKKAYGMWINDTFWLNPVVKLFDPGVERSIVTVDAKEHLMMQFSSGGITPGDSYLWELGKDKRPVRWKMWVSIIPIGGIGSTWENYKQLQSGAWVATKHSAGPIDLMISQLKSANDIHGLYEQDPFAPLHP